MIWNTPFWELQNLGTSRLFTSQGIFGGYPGSVAYIHNIRANNLRELAEAGEAYPVADGPFDDPALMAIDGEREYKLDNFTLLDPVRRRRPLSLGDEGRRRASATRSSGRPTRSQRDIAEGHIEPSTPSGFTRVADRDARPGAGVWSALGRRRVVGRASASGCSAGDLIEPVKAGYAESMKLSPRWAAEFRGFWDLPEDFAFERRDADRAARPACPSPAR